MSSIPFYTQAAFLEQNAKLPNPSEYPEMVGVILDALDKHEDLRQYFYRCGPSPAWARILFERGYLSDAPAPQQVQDGYRLLGWPQQIYLVTVAEQVPDVVCQHLEVVTGHPRYIAVAVEALSKLKSEDISNVMPALLRQLEKAEILEYAFEHVERIMRKLVQDGYVEDLFTLAETYTRPTLKRPQSESDEPTYQEAQSRVRQHHLDNHLDEILDLLCLCDIQATIELLQQQLLRVLELETTGFKTERVQNYSWWRSAIEETGQDDIKDYRDVVLEGLRDVLNKLAQDDPVALEEILVGYLSSEYVILRRLGLYLLTKYPSQYAPYVRETLVEKKNLSEVAIHHEIFTLLEAGVPYLNEDEYKILVSGIVDGPPAEEVEKLVRWRSKRQEIDEDAYRDRYKKIWVRDRLWMIQNLLSGEDAEYLTSLVTETGEPEHPAFTRWSSAFSVKDVSALSDDEISGKTPEQLVQFIRAWQPPDDQIFDPEQVTYRGMGGQIARLVTNNLPIYSGHLAEIALVHPQYAYAILEHVKSLTSSTLPWNTRLDFFEHVLAELAPQPRSGEISSTEVKRSIIANLEVGLHENELEKAVPIEFLNRVRNILIELVEDPDPSLEDDRPAEGWFGHNDPATVALNTVRPSALAALIRCARYRAVRVKDDNASTSPLPLESEVKQALERKLVDPSWAVRSVLGRFFPLLCWLDRSWVLAHVNEIFPEGDNHEDKLLFTAAWESYVLFNVLYTSLFNELVHKYKRAIQLLDEGYKTENHLQPVQKLAMHLLIQFVHEGGSILSTSQVSAELLRRFFTDSSGEHRSQAAWGVWRYCNDNKLTPDRWKSLRGLWEWRTNEAIASGHTSDFNREINWFVKLVSFAPDDENLLTLWPLLEGAVPHVSSDSFSLGFESLEEFLIKQADTYPLETVQLYRTILERLLSRTGYVHIRNENVRAILEKTALSEEARKETLDTIDMCARRGHHQFRDIYERYTR